jgi:hypothetical protein
VPTVAEHEADNPLAATNQRVYVAPMPSFVKSVTFDCHDPMRVAVFWAEVLGSNVDEDSTPERAWVEPAGWGGPNLWFQKVPEGKTAKNRQHFDLRAMGPLDAERDRLVALGATVTAEHGDDLYVMADPGGNEFCLET